MGREDKVIASIENGSELWCVDGLDGGHCGNLIVNLETINTLLAKGIIEKCVPVTTYKLTIDYKNSKRKKEAVKG